MSVRSNSGTRLHARSIASRRPANAVALSCLPILSRTGSAGSKSCRGGRAPHSGAARRAEEGRAGQNIVFGDIEECACLGGRRRDRFALLRQPQVEINIIGSARNRTPCWSLPKITIRVSRSRSWESNLLPPGTRARNDLCPTEVRKMALVPGATTLAIAGANASGAQRPVD
jgi:hypothetical protein